MVAYRTQTVSTGVLATDRRIDMKIEISATVTMCFEIGVSPSRWGRMSDEEKECYIREEVQLRAGFNQVQSVEWERAE